MSKRRATLTELAAEVGVTVGTIRYRVQRRQMTPPDRHGRFDAARALAELAAKRKQRGGRKSGPTKIADVASSRPRDPADRFRLARARQEELKLRRMERSLIEAEVVRRRVFAFVRLIRDRMDAAVSREAPLGAAHFKIDEGDFWRWLKGMMTRLQTELATLDLDKALGSDPPEDSEEGDDGDEEDGARSREHRPGAVR